MEFSEVRVREHLRLAFEDALRRRSLVLGAWRVEISVDDMRLIAGETLAGCGTDLGLPRFEGALPLMYLDEGDLPASPDALLADLFEHALDAIAELGHDLTP